MKYFYWGFNIFLIVMISIFIFVSPKENNISLKNTTKSMTTSSFNVVQLRKDNKSENVNEDDNNKKDDLEESLDKTYKEISNNVAPASVVNPVLETQVGSLAAYGPDCAGCSGRLGGGFDARGGNIYYNDSVYGNIRILAGDSKYPYGTIVRVSGTTLGTFNAIVLDRGGGVGFGKRFLFDLLCPSNSDASNLGSFQNVTFEILRYGY